MNDTILGDMVFAAIHPSAAVARIAEMRSAIRIVFPPAPAPVYHTASGMVDQAPAPAPFVVKL